MCVFDSFSLASSTVSMISSALESAWSLYSKIETIKVNNLQTEMNINAAKQNAETARQNAMLERQEALEDARRQRLKTIQNISSLKTEIASGNIDLNSGTSLDLIDSLSLSGELDALNILEKGEERAKKQLLAANTYDEKSAFYILQGRSDTMQSTGELLGDSFKTAQNTYNKFSTQFN